MALGERGSKDQSGNFGQLGQAVLRGEAITVCGKGKGADGAKRHEDKVPSSDMSRDHSHLEN